MGIQTWDDLKIKIQFPPKFKYVYLEKFSPRVKQKFGKVPVWFGRALQRKISNTTESHTRNPKLSRAKETASSSLPSAKGSLLRINLQKVSQSQKLTEAHRDWGTAVWRDDKIREKNSTILPPHSAIATSTLSFATSLHEDWPNTERRCFQRDLGQENPTRNQQWLWCEPMREWLRERQWVSWAGDQPHMLVSLHAALPLYNQVAFCSLKPVNILR